MSSLERNINSPERGIDSPERGIDSPERQFPFVFASTHGMLLEPGSSPVTVLCRKQPPLALLAELARRLGPDFILEPVSDHAFQQKLSTAFARDNSVAVQVAEDLGADGSLAQLAEEIPATGDLMEGEDHAPVIKLINALISQAIRERASDIHIEPYEDRLSVRFRTDGVLNEVLSPKRMLASLLVSRIKVMARLDIAEKRLPQDGRISVRLAGHALDIRVSTMPSAHGERVVLRLLDKQSGKMELDQLHMPEAVLASYKQALHSPHGIILVTGPTGSGKTTTLYAGIMHINNKRQNILTIEDPVEYTLPGVGQTQVNTKIGLTFANGLRSILRQDPDVVMLGEIRDTDSARIAVQASLTGHLVLSTLHTNTAIGAITRLQDMGIESFLLGSSLVAVMSQRLVRVLCRHCREPYQAEESERRLLGAAAGRELILYRPAGCEHCRGSGYQHRTGIFECIRIDGGLRKLIHDEAGEEALLQYARGESRSLHDDGMRAVLDGTTSLAEVLRVTAA